MLDYSLLRKFNPNIDTGALTPEGRHIPFNIAENLYNAGVPYLKARPLAWMDDQPIYPDSLLYRHVFNDYARADSLGSLTLALEHGNVSWLPPFEDETPDGPEESLVEIYIDGERVFCELAPLEAAEALAEYCELLTAND